MSNVFNINRFGKYFVYDLNKGVASCGLSLLELGLMPVIFCLFYELFSLLVTHGISPVHIGGKIAIFFIVLIVLIMMVPARMYGSLTEKRTGADWLMIPASSFEKFLSMAIMLCVVVPVVFFALFFASDFLLSVIFPPYGESITKSGLDGISSAISAMDSEMLSISHSGSFAILWLSFCMSILPFGLGALIFKKAKVAKTLLCLFAISMIFIFLLVAAAEHGFLSDSDAFEAFFENMDADRLQNTLNIIMNVFYAVLVGGLLAGLYFRIKTLKH